MTATPAPCSRCGKPPELCVCADVTPIDNRISLVVIQHPQEQDVTLGTARLAVAHLKNAALKIGLSWPGLGKVVGRTADAKKWGVLYLGSAKMPPGRDIAVLDRKGVAVPDSDQILAQLEGVIVLDGTWSQAKALWWRNAWMLKLRRIALNPKRPSLYGKLRREPRRESLSTLESAGLVLSRLENRPEIQDAMTASFARMLARFREQKS